jgi:Sulfotransferase family
MTLPNFVIIGAGRSGTNQLYSLLTQHPQIYMSPVKEPNFFAFEGQELCFRGPGDDDVNRHSVIRLSDYRELFRGVSSERAVGEASPRYMEVAGTAERIRHHIPDAKLIAILRDPIERAYSSFLLHVRDGRECCRDLGEALRLERQRRDENWSWGAYFEGSLYYQQLSRFWRVFPSEQIRIFLFEDLVRHRRQLLHDVFRFLSVDEDFEPGDEGLRNRGGTPRSRLLHRALTANAVTSRVKSLLPTPLRTTLAARLRALRESNLDRPPLGEEVRRELAERYKEEVAKLEAAIGRDLSHWLRRDAAGTAG